MVGIRNWMLGFGMVLGLASRVSGAEEDRGGVKEAVDALIARTRTEEVKELIRVNGERLKDLDWKTAERGVDFFRDIRAGEVLMAILGDPKLHDEAKLPAAKAALDFVAAGDVQAADYLADCLRKTDVLVTGGSEISIPHARLQNALVALLMKITGETYPLIDENDNRVGSEWISRIGRGVDAWVEERKKK